MPYVSLNGQDIYFEDSGGHGSPIVMMHGFLMDQHLFDPQVRILAPKYRCVRFDARAFGKTRWDGKAFSLYDTVSDCSGLMDYLGIKRAVIVGMSQGGYAALRMAIVKPDRVSALVLMSTQADVNDAAFTAQCAEMAETWKSQGPVEPLIEALAAALLGPKENPDIEEHWKTWIPKWKMHSGNAIFQATNALNGRDNIDDRIKEIMQPALITHGEKDVAVHLSLGEKLKRNLLNCHELVAVPDAAHAANYTHPDLINKALVKFLNQCNA